MIGGAFRDGSTADDGTPQIRRGAWAAAASLFASGGTLVCCALPALLVALGAGAALSALVGAVPQIVWLSERKAEVFGVAAVMLAVAGALQWRSRLAPCPVEPALRDACLRTRRNAVRFYVASLACFAVGGFFAFVLPALTA